MLKVLLGILRLGWRGAFFAALVLALSHRVATLTLAGANAVVGGAVAAATGVRTKAEDAVGEAGRRQDEMTSLPARICTRAPEWIC